MDHTLTQQLLEALDTPTIKPDEKLMAIKIMNKHPNIVQKLADTKDLNGQPLFDPLNIVSFLAHSDDITEKHLERIDIILDNPEEIKDIMVSSTPHAAGLLLAVHHPLDSTLNMLRIKKIKEKAQRMSARPRKMRKKVLQKYKNQGRGR